MPLPLIATGGPSRRPAARAAGILSIALFLLFGFVGETHATYRVIHSHQWEWLGDADGSTPRGSLVLGGDGILYGTTYGGGLLDLGTVFAVASDGNSFTILHEFMGGVDDGAFPLAGLITDGAGHLFGTTEGGGPASAGTIFRMNQDGTGFTILHGFGSGATDGVAPVTPLILDTSGNLYGTTLCWGPTGNGTIFTVRTDGTGFKVLHAFTTPTDCSYSLSYVVLGDSGRMYGTTGGGPSNYGTIFKMKTDGKAFEVLHTFVGGAFDGAYPRGVVFDRSAGLIGTTVFGGSSDGGTVYKLRTNGTGFSLLHSFSDGSDGAGPAGPPVLDRWGNLYGTTAYGGPSSGVEGTVYRMKADGSGFTVLHAFAKPAGDGIRPQAPPILDASGDLFGTTLQGGSWDKGVEFRLAARPGDANNDGSADVADVFYLINALFADGPSPFAGGDVNGDGAVDVTDIFYLINYLFANAPAPTN
jgi:uncharacterized repeat protein (TIGR03803 family)